MRSSLCEVVLVFPNLHKQARAERHDSLAVTGSSAFSATHVYLPAQHCKQGRVRSTKGGAQSRWLPSSLFLSDHAAILTRHSLILLSEASERKRERRTSLDQSKPTISPTHLHHVYLSHDPDRALASSWPTRLSNSITHHFPLTNQTYFALTSSLSAFSFTYNLSR